MAKLSYSESGRKGAERFWMRFHQEEEFRKRMLEAWRRPRPDREKLRKAASLGGLAFWKKYKSDPEFKKLIDGKLKESRSRGGSIIT
ncbi:MAG: hypothetical protein ACUVTD_06645 [Nitrososphaerales archaeon]